MHVEMIQFGILVILGLGLTAYGLTSVLGASETQELVRSTVIAVAGIILMAASVNVRW